MSVALESWANSNPTFVAASGTGQPTTYTYQQLNASEPITEFCLRLKFDRESGGFSVTLKPFYNGLCAESLWSPTLQVPDTTKINSMIVQAQSSRDSAAQLEDFVSLDFYSECLLGDVNVPAGIQTKTYNIRGPFDCGFEFESIKLTLPINTKFTLSFDVFTGICQYAPDCGSQASSMQLLLEPLVTCVQPCLPYGDTDEEKLCLVDLGYVNRFSTTSVRTVTTDGTLFQYSDMGYKYHPPHSKENNVVNIMFPGACSALKQNPKFINPATGKFQLTDNDQVQCDPFSNSYCSLHSYIYNYNAHPETLWEDDPFSQLKTIQYWRDQFGWDYTTNQTKGVSFGYAGFRGQPTVFAPGKKSSVASIPILLSQHFCWVLGNSMVDICADETCRFSHESVGCSYSSGPFMHYSHFWVEMRLGDTAANNFMRTTIGYGDYNYDNAWRLHVFTQIEKCYESDTLKRISGVQFSLPSPCMRAENGTKTFILESFNLDCGYDDNSNGLHSNSTTICPYGICSNPLVSSLGGLEISLATLSACSNSPNCSGAQLIDSYSQYAVQGGGSPLLSVPTKLAQSYSGNNQKSIWNFQFSGTPFCGGSTYYPYKFTYACSGVDEHESSVCAYVNYENYLKGESNDIRQVLNLNPEKIIQTRGNPTFSTLDYDPDADGVRGWTSSYYCALTGSIVNVPSCDISYGCGSSVHGYLFPHLYEDASVDSEQLSAPSCGCCGNGVCEPNYGEDCFSCPFDCKWTDDVCCGRLHTYDNHTSACANYDICSPGEIHHSGTRHFEMGVLVSSHPRKKRSDLPTTPAPTPTPSLFNSDVTCVLDTCPQRICYHCIGNRIPLTIETIESLPSLESYPVLSTVCAFELEKPCNYCSETTSGDGCNSGKVCNLETCTCEPECEYSVSCTTWSGTCDAGYIRMTAGT